MDKLKIELFRYDNLVFGKVIHQDESLRECDPILTDTVTGFGIRSMECPYLYDDELYIRGSSKGSDNDLFSTMYADEARAKVVCESIERLVGRINGDDLIPPSEVEQIL